MAKTKKKITPKKVVKKKEDHYVVLAADKSGTPYSRSGDIHVGTSPEDVIEERSNCCDDLLTGDVVYQLVPVGKVDVPRGANFIPLTPKTKKK